MNKTNDPWLYTGCPCEVVTNKTALIKIKQLLYFSSFDHQNKPLFKIEKGIKASFLKQYTYYKPIGTPWDNSPPEAAFIQIDNQGNCEFFAEKDDFDSISVRRNSDYFGEFEIYYQKILIPWPACPEHLRGKTWPRPEWGKEKYE